MVTINNPTANQAADPAKACKDLNNLAVRGHLQCDTTSRATADPAVCVTGSLKKILPRAIACIVCPSNTYYDKDHYCKSNDSWTPTCPAGYEGVKNSCGKYECLQDPNTRVIY